MGRSQIRFHRVDFIYEGQPEPLFRGLNLALGRGWTGLVGSNGTGKTTLLKLALGLLTPSGGRVESLGDGIYCEQGTEETPSDFERFLNSLDGEAQRIRGLLGLEQDWARRWRSLSHGERKRSQLGLALWQRPAVLAADEPTNHLDRPARSLILKALKSYNGVGLLVSHDRELLDELCQNCVFVESPRAILRPGNYTDGSAQAELEREAAGRARVTARRKAENLVREAALRRNEAAQAHKKRSKSGLDPKDHDSRGKINLARLTGKDGQAGRLLRQLQGRVDQAQENLELIRVPKKRRIGIRLTGSASPRNALVRRKPGILPLGPDRELVHGELELGAESRIALSGPNGAGKSTLIRALLSAANLPRDKILYISQELGAGEAEEVLNQVIKTPPAERGRLMTLVSRLGSHPERLLGTAVPSPGEARKLLLALGLLRSPHWIVMDEPTNHMDLPSIECLEKALAEVPCALLLVSHDERFLKSLTSTRWSIVQGPKSSQGRLVIA